MNQYNNNNQGALFKNDKGDNQARPDYRGEITIEGKAYKLSAWINTAKDGKKYIKLKAEPKQDMPPQTQHETAKVNAYQPQPEEQDEIPF